MQLVDDEGLVWVENPPLYATSKPGNRRIVYGFDSSVV
jgi:hypothetical protein